MWLPRRLLPGAKGEISAAVFHLVSSKHSEDISRHSLPPHGCFCELWQGSQALAADRGEFLPFIYGLMRRIGTWWDLGYTAGTEEMCWVSFLITGHAPPPRKSHCENWGTEGAMCPQVIKQPTQSKSQA